jgi:hypothetical protein
MNTVEEGSNDPHLKKMNDSVNVILMSTNNLLHRHGLNQC